MEFIVDRSKWRCGNDGKYAKGQDDTFMENNEGFMCCLGHCQKQLTPNADMVASGMPRIVVERNHLGIDNNPFVKMGEYNRILNTELALQAADINDSINFNHKERERQLKSLFKRNGHTIKFVGKTVKYIQPY